MSNWTANGNRGAELTQQISAAAVENVCANSPRTALCFFSAESGDTPLTPADPCWPRWPRPLRPVLNSISRPSGRRTLHPHDSLRWADARRCRRRHGANPDRPRPTAAAPPGGIYLRAPPPRLPHFYYSSLSAMRTRRPAENKEKARECSAHRV